ncbi:MAG: hypothetical protein PHQ81_09955 [Methanofollis sp.]|nr:hypothetical protein [Methanofollis sp.]
MVTGEKARMVGFKYRGTPSGIRGTQKIRPDEIDFQGIVRDADKKGKKIFKESRMMSIKLK